MYNFGMNTKIKQIKSEISKCIVGHENVIDALLIGLFTGGHILLEGVPGLAKTKTVNALANVLSLSFKRIQFTPDLLPSDIVGTQIFDMKEQVFKTKKGPIFANLVLADEINRAPAKVQSALLEVMAEKQITISEETFSLDLPFCVLATQNPIEQEGVYSLPEAQLDRFMFKIIVGYNTKEEELLMASSVSNYNVDVLKPMITKDEILQIQKEIQDVHIDKELQEYIIDIIFATREPKKYDLEEISDYIACGASPRAGIAIFKASKAKAYLKGNDYVDPIDIATVAKDVLRHRITLTYEAEAEGITSEDIISKILKNVKIP